MKRDFHWMFYIARRFSSVDRKGRSSLTSLLSSAGLAFGVMALVTVLAVMNGFQSGYIDTILEVNSSHIRVEQSSQDLDNNLVSQIQQNNDVSCVTPFLEVQGLLEGNRNRQQGVAIRAVQPDVCFRDVGFASELVMQEGVFDLSSSDSIILGSELARMLSLSVGNTVTLLAVAGGSGTDMFPDNKEFTVAGIFATGYYEIDCAFAFIPLETGETFFASDVPYVYGIKLHDANTDIRVIPMLDNLLAKDGKKTVRICSWREYNRAFFGALKVEKNVMIILIFLIFLVVAVNIYHSMRRAVFERREEIVMLVSLGARPFDVRAVFIINGLSLGFVGSAFGIVLGLLLSVNINGLFSLTETIVNGLQHFIFMLTMVDSGDSFSIFNPAYFYLTEVPVKIYASELLLICAFGISASVLAALKASSSILKLKPAEVLRYE